MKGSAESVSLGECCVLLLLEVVVLRLGLNSVLVAGCGLEEAEDTASTRLVRTLDRGSGPTYVVDVQAMKSGKEEVAGMKLRTT
jgi:hypothetical protein